MKANATPERKVRCPRCRGPAVYSARNPWRPFCSERCRNADLGAWASENYRVDTQASAEDLPEEPPLPQ